MRVALVHMRHALSGGTERYLNFVARLAAERGHEVTVVCRTHQAAPHPAVRFDVLRDVALGSAGRMWAFARSVERRLRDGGHDLVYGLGKTWTHDVVRLGGGLHASYLERAHPFTRTWWERWFGTDRLKQRLALVIEARALAPGNYVHVVANSRMVKRDCIERHGVPEERVTVIHNGVDLERFPWEERAGRRAALRAELGLARGEPTVLFLGTGYGRKGLDRLLEAFPTLLARRPSARLLVVGRDAAPGRFEARARRLGIDSRVRFLGGRSDVPALFAASDVYCLPTRYDSFGLTILEALASGLPVVTSDAAGGSEVLDPTVGSVVRAEAAPEELARELAAWTDPGRAETVAPQARARAEEYPRERTASESVTLLERVHEGGGRLPSRSGSRLRSGSDGRLGFEPR